MMLSATTLVTVLLLATFALAVAAKQGESIQCAHCTACPAHCSVDRGGGFPQLQELVKCTSAC